MEVTLLSISLGIAIIAFIVNYLYFNSKIEGKDREISRIIQEHYHLRNENYHLNRICEEFTKSCNQHHEARLLAETELKRLKNETAKDSIRINVDADKMNEVVSKTKQQIAELITVELFSSK